MQHLSPQSRFADRYEIVRVISTGGMGAVYEVIHLQTKRRRALKVMLPARMADADMRERFAREATVTADVSSEHIVEIFDAGIDEASASPFIVMELLKGEDLAKRLERLGPRPWREVADTLTQVGRALDRTHAEGIIHRDLKPENLFWTVRDDGSPKIKVLDFGIAKLLVNADMAGSTRPIGTPLYMAPEQIEGRSAKMAPVVDVYALGHIAFTLLSGKPYFADEAERIENVLGLLTHVARGVGEDPSDRARRRGVALPSGFDAWFRRATSLEPSERFPRAGELADAFSAVFGTTVVRAVSSDARRDDDPPLSMANAHSATAPIAEKPRPKPAAVIAPTEAEIPELSSSRADASAPSNVAALDLSAPPSVRTKDIARALGRAPPPAPARSRLPLVLGAVVLAGGIAAAAVTFLPGGDAPTTKATDDGARAGATEVPASGSDTPANESAPASSPTAPSVLPAPTGSTSATSPPAPDASAGKPRVPAIGGKPPPAASTANVPPPATVIPSSVPKSWETHRNPVVP